VDTLLAIYGYAAQIYCDFSGYTDIAVGCALLLGFHLPRNFNAPYKALTRRNSGAAGTYRFQGGCAIISTSRWAAPGKVPCALDSTSC
jgi:hypothetical protein